MNDLQRVYMLQSTCNVSRNDEFVDISIQEGVSPLNPLLQRTPSYVLCHDTRLQRIVYGDPMQEYYIDMTTPFTVFRYWQRDR